MYSNDMWRHHPENPEYWGQWPLQFWENGEVIIPDVDKSDQKHLTRWYTEHAVNFIDKNQDHPFFLYLPHSMPHVPLFCSEEFNGKSGLGLYGDVMLEIDWSVGQINKTLKENGIDRNTLVIFTSDNGPWISYGNHAGNTPFREAKGTSFDGGVRSACIMKMPGQIGEGQISTSTLGTVDLLPTLCHLAGIPLPENEIDGKNVWDLITGVEGAKNPHEYYAFSNGRNFEGVMSGDGKWKLHLPHEYRTLETPGKDGLAGKYSQSKIDTALFNMEQDPFETTNVLEQFPDVANQLIDLAEKHKAEFYSAE
jgi:arylsulfatase A-like enzyme